MGGRAADNIVTCPHPGCDYGEDGGKAKFRAPTMKRALRMRDDHLKSAHKGWKPPTGAMIDKRPRLD